MPYYTQLDDNDICIGVFSLSGTVDAKNMMEIAEYDTTLLGKRLNGKTWEDVPTPEPPEPTPQTLYTAEEFLSVMRDMTEKVLATKPTINKEGYEPVLTYTNEGAFVWEMKAIEGYIPQNDGTDYLKPITYVDGMTVTTGLWYTDGSDTWEAIADGVPTGFDDREYFDIVG